MRSNRSPVIVVVGVLVAVGLLVAGMVLIIRYSALSPAAG